MKKRRRTPLVPNPPAQRGSGFGAMAFGVTTVGLVFLAIWFFSLPIPLFSDAQGAVPRISITLWPILDSTLYAELWGLGRGGPALRFVFSLYFCAAFLTMAFVIGRWALFALRIGKTLRQSERIFFSLALGLIAESVLGMIFVATGNVDLLWANSLFFGVVLFLGRIALPLIIVWANIPRLRKGNAIKRTWKAEHGSPMSTEERRAFYKRNFRRLWRRITLFVPNSPVTIALGTLGVLFAAVYFLAGTVPPAEYDMLEYHAQGAREMLESGRIAFSPHNAYQNMPQGAEMFLVWGDAFFLSFSSGSNWERGLLLGTCCGKALLACFAPILSLGLYAFCVRFFRARRVGLLAAVVYLAFPGAFQTFACGLNDGVLALAAFGTFYALGLLFSKPQKSRWGIIAGLFAGFAVSIKYTGVVFVALPALGVLLGWFALCFFSHKGTKVQRERCGDEWSARITLGAITAFIAAAVAVGGFWYGKNGVLTGNPVWPLAYSVFGDSTGTWTPEIAARWQNAHSPHKFGPTALFSPLYSFLITDSFASPFLCLFGITGIWLAVRKRIDSPYFSFLIFGYSLFFVALWLLATHRLLRFLDPALPFFAILAAVGAAGVMKGTRSRLLRGLVGALVIFCGYYALVLDATTSSDFFTPTERIVSDTNRYGDWSASIARGDFTPTTDKRLLLVGEARAFAFRAPILYATCWNRSPLIDVLPETFLARSEKALAENRPVTFDFTQEEITRIKANFAAKKIGYVLVDYGEIERFNSPGNYGSTDANLLRPELFQTLEIAGVWAKYRPKGFDGFSPRTKQKTIVYRVLE